MSEIKFLTVCGAGVGTSTLLRINIGNVLSTLDLDRSYSVENVSMSRAKGIKCDFVITFESFANEAREFCDSVLVIKNLMDKNELKEKLTEALTKKGYIKG